MTLYSSEARPIDRRLPWEIDQAHLVCQACAYAAHPSTARTRASSSTPVPECYCSLKSRWRAPPLVRTHWGRCQRPSCIPWLAKLRPPTRAVGRLAAPPLAMSLRTLAGLLRRPSSLVRTASQAAMLNAQARSTRLRVRVPAIRVHRRSHRRSGQAVQTAHQGRTRLERASTRLKCKAVSFSCRPTAQNGWRSCLAACLRARR